ncbi:unnamed protein product [Cuscuta campestris]|uniref:Secreted protein n=1 Tax=Cuscuta campestris TaxID=132261 RepID=A0A484KF97_9ASTE|nr:unnamed protein product [Cuscuta campestris]
MYMIMFALLLNPSFSVRHPLSCSFLRLSPLNIAEEKNTHRRSPLRFPIANQIGRTPPPGLRFPTPEFPDREAQTTVRA